jgi:hypothetical protein
MNHTGKWRSLRRLLLAATTAALMFCSGAATLVIMSSAAPARASDAQPQARPGGCHRDNDGGPFTASTCISSEQVWNGGGWTTVINTDAYVDIKPPGCFYLEIDLYDHNGSRVARGSWQRFCNTGRYVGPRIAWPIWGAPFYSELTIVNGHDSYVFDSPYIG